MKFEIGVASLQGSRKRQEDRSSVVGKDGAVLAAVFDGLGGVPNGVEAAQAAAGIFDACPFDAAPIPLLTRLVADAHWAVKRTGGMTCLAAALFLPDGTLALANVGDPAVVRIRFTPGGSCIYTPLTDRDRTSRHTVLHSLGSTNWHGRVQKGAPVRAGDRYLIATDGVIDALPPDVSGILRAFPADPQRIASTLVKSAADQPNSDNATIIVVDVRV